MPDDEKIQEETAVEDRVVIDDGQDDKNLTTSEDDKEFQDAFMEFAKGEDIDESKSGEDKSEERTTDVKQKEAEDKDPQKDESKEESAEEKIARLERENQALNHRVKSDTGRIGPLQQKIDQLTAIVQKFSTPQQKGQTKKENLQPEELVPPDTWKEIEEEYPDIAKGFKDFSKVQQESVLKLVREMVNDTVSKELTPIKQDHQKRQQRDDEAAAQAAATKLSEYHSDYYEIGRSEDFSQWLSTQSSAMQALRQSQIWEDARTVLDAYKRDRGIALKPSEKKPEDQSATSQKITQLSEKRKKQLQDSQSIRTRGSAVRSDDTATGDFNTFFDIYSQKQEEKRQKHAVY